MAGTQSTARLGDLMAQPRPHDRQGRTRMPSLGDLDTSNLDDYAPM